MKEVIKHLKLQLVDTQNRILYTERAVKEKQIVSEYFKTEKSKSMRFEAELILAIKILQGATTHGFE